MRRHDKYKNSKAHYDKYSSKKNRPHLRMTKRDRETSLVESQSNRNNSKSNRKHNKFSLEENSQLQHKYKHIAYETMEIIENKQYTNMRNDIVSLEEHLNNMSFTTYSPQDKIDIKHICGKYLLKETQYIVRKQSTLEAFFQEDRVNTDKFLSTLYDTEYFNISSEDITEDKICILNLASPTAPADKFVTEAELAKQALEDIDSFSEEDKRLMINLTLRSNTSKLSSSNTKQDFTNLSNLSSINEEDEYNSLDEEDRIKERVKKRTSIIEDKMLKEQMRKQKIKTKVGSTKDNATKNESTKDNVTKSNSTKADHIKDDSIKTKSSFIKGHSRSLSEGYSKDIVNSEDVNSSPKERLISHNKSSVKPSKKKSDINPHSSLEIPPRESNKICILNFASARNPGGGFLKGASTQEETLAKCSALYESIYDSEMYKVNNADNNNCLYSHYMIYSKNVPIFRDDNMELLNMPCKADFITAPAVNTKEALKRGVSQQTINDTMDMRMDRLFSLCVLNDVDILILGTWGCGVFGGDFKVISTQFMNWLTLKYYGYFKKVIFSVSSDIDYNIMKFINYDLDFQ